MSGQGTGSQWDAWIDPNRDFKRIWRECEAGAPVLTNQGCQDNHLVGKVGQTRIYVYGSERLKNARRGGHSVLAIGQVGINNTLLKFVMRFWQMLVLWGHRGWASCFGVCYLTRASAHRDALPRSKMTPCLRLAGLSDIHTTGLSCNGVLRSCFRLCATKEHGTKTPQARTSPVTEDWEVRNSSVSNKFLEKWELNHHRQV